MLSKFTGSTFLRYGVMAVFVVSIEVFLFWFIESILGWQYLIATWVSLIVGIVLNWIGSRVFVFGKSRHSNTKEFGLIATASLVGIVIQSCVVYLAVEALNRQALIGKVVAIIVTFFWNYLIRKHYVYKEHKIDQ